jgi:DNA-binding beta-propeller fold protein YncE
MLLALLLSSWISAASPAPCAVCWYGPDNMVFDPAGNLYVVDTDGKSRGRVVELSSDGRLVDAWHVFAPASGGRFGPEGIAREASGTLLVTDAAAQRILELSTDGRVLGTFGGAHDVFPSLGHVAVDAAGNVYVAQGELNLIDKFLPTGVLAASWHRERGSAEGQWSFPETIAATPSGNLVVEDWANHRIEILSSAGTTLATFGRAGSRAGEFTNTAGLGVDRSGNV